MRFQTGAACAVTIAAWLCSAVTAMGEPPASAPQAADPWVLDGKEALRDSWGRPWYDPQNDSMAVPEFKPEKRPYALPDGVHTLVQWLAWGIIAAILAGLIGVLIRAYLARETARAAPRATTVRSPTAADRVEALPLGLQRSEDDLLAAARKYFEAGNYSEAIIYLFSHQLVELDRAQCIRLAKGKTNRQYLKELANRADLRGMLAQTIERFEPVFFGAQSLDRAAFEACWRQLPRFQTLLAGNKP